jgi:hypothetical protein
MNYVGVDIHKKYSVLCALDEGRAQAGASTGERVINRASGMFFDSAAANFKFAIPNWSFAPPRSHQLPRCVTAYPPASQLGVFRVWHSAFPLSTC